MSLYYPSESRSPAEDRPDGPSTPAGGENQPPMITVRLPQSRPRVCYTLLGLSILVYVAQYLSQSLLGVDLPAAIGVKLHRAIEAGQYWRLLTPMLLHGSLIHIAFNMYALYVIGPGLERYYGHWRFLTLYLLSGFAGNVISFLLTPNPSLGASTAIFGLIAAQAVFIYGNRFLYGQNAQRMLVNIGIIMAVNLILGLSPQIDNWGHLGGLVGGGLFAWLAGPRMKIGGQPPEFSLVDQLSGRRAVWLAAALVIFFSLLAALKVFQA